MKRIYTVRKTFAIIKRGKNPADYADIMQPNCTKAELSTPTVVHKKATSYKSPARVFKSNF